MLYKGSMDLLARRAAACFALALGSGCVSSERYIVDPTSARAPGEGHLVAHRKSDGRKVELDPAAIRFTDSNTGEVEAGGASPMVTAGVVTTLVGSALSILGTITYFATLNGHDDLHFAGGMVALSGEPLMIAGSVLWPLGLVRPPRGVRLIPESRLPPPPPVVRPGQSSSGE
jgi:hypothetical protein